MMEAILEYIKQMNPGRSTQTRVLWYQAIISGIQDINNVEKGKLDREELEELMEGPQQLEEHSRRMFKKFARYGGII